MKKIRTCLLSAVLAFTVLAASIQQSHALLPVLVWSVARQVAVVTAETVAFDVVAKGLASSDPYVRTTATLPRSQFARNVSKLRGPRWVGVLALLATVAGLGWDYDDEVGLYTPVRSVPPNGYCPGQGIMSAEACLDALLPLSGASAGYPLEPYPVDCGTMPNACPNVVMQIDYCSAPNLTIL